jgi:trimeric autotransporter adhesin
MPASSSLRRRSSGYRTLLAIAFLCGVSAAASAQTLTPGGLSFGNQVVGQASTGKPATLKNTTASPIQILAVAIGGGNAGADFTAASTCPAPPLTLAAGKSCTLPVTLNPSALGSRTATLTVTHTGPTSPQAVALTGTGIAPVTLTPATLAFGNQAQGTVSVTRIATVANVESTPLEITGILSTGDFSIDPASTCPMSPQLLSGGSNCSIVVAYHPSVVASEVGTLTITDRAGVSVPTINLTGTGITPVTLSAANVGFAATAVGNVGATKSITLTNHKSTPLNFSSIAATGDFAIVGNACGTQDGPGAPCIVTLAFAPTAAGARAGVLSFTDDAANSSQVVNLSGTATASVTAAPATVAFTTAIPIGTTSAVKSVTLTNHETVPITVSSVVASGDFAVASDTCLAGVAPSGTCAIGVTFTPTAIGTRTGTLTIGDGTPDGPLALSLTGTGNSAGLTSIAIAPATATVALGLTQQFTATGTFTGGRKADMTASVTWNSTLPSIAAFSTVAGPQGLATSVAAGTTSITAKSGSIMSAPASLTVTPPALTSIAVTPSHASVALGVQQPFVATGSYTNGSTVDVTSTVSWSSSLQTVASIGGSGIAGSTGTGTTTITARSGSIGGSAILDVTPALLVSLSIAPVNPSVAAGLTRTFTATATFTDGTNQNVTSAVAWSSSAPSVAQVNAAGVATALAPGTAQIGATAGSISAATTMTVAPAALASIALAPADGSIALGTTQQYVATGTYTDGSTQDITGVAAWGSSSSTVATLGATGLATSKTTGATTVAAALGAVVGTTTLTITPAQPLSIAITPAIPAIPLGRTQQFTATGTFTDGSVQDITSSVTWTSSDGSVATVDMSAGTKGLAVTKAVGSTNIGAAASGISASTTLTVLPAAIVSIAVTPVSATIAKGTTQGFTAIATYTDATTRDVTTASSWNSSAGITASVTAAGVATAQQVGAATISATDGGVTGSASLQVTSAALSTIFVTPAAPSIPLGTTQQFTASGVYTDGSAQDLTATVHWSAPDGSIATISNAPGTAGLAMGVAVGTSPIVADAAGVSGSSSLVVTPASLLSIAVTPATATIPLGASQQFAAVGTYTDGTTKDITTSVAWTTSAATVAVFSNQAGAQGLAISSGFGSTTATATMDAVSGSASLNVGTPQVVSIAVTPASASVAVGRPQTFAAVATYSNGTTADVTTSAMWVSSNLPTASIDATGIATALAEGSATISATFGGQQGSAALTVLPPVVTAIGLSPSSLSFVIGGSPQAVTATATYSNGAIANSSASAGWSTSDMTVATVSAGLVSPVGAGTAIITATADGVSASLTASVTAQTQATLTALAIAPLNGTIVQGVSVAFTATGTYSDSTQRDVTASVSWSSSTQAIASIGAGGLVMTGASGTTTIGATLGGQSASTTLTVIDLATGLTQIVVSPLQAAMAVGGTQAFTATGTYGGSAYDLTPIVTWNAAPGGVATITPAGIATGVSNGTATITAAAAGLVGAASLTVGPVNHGPVANAGANQTVHVGDTAQLSAAASTDADGDPLTYAWSIASAPAGSTAQLSALDTVASTLTIDQPGAYVVGLIVNDGHVNSSVSTVTISTTNTAPVANAGPAQTVAIGSTVTLDGSGSTDVDHDMLTYRWSLAQKPSGSAAQLSDPSVVKPTFVMDLPGHYVAQLFVNDGTVDSVAATVTITSVNSAPVANAGANQSVTVGSLVALDGGGSSDVDADPLTYRWSLTTVPAGSGALLTSASSSTTSFVADVPGLYVAQLIVNDGHVDSVPSTVTITTQNSAPVANAGANQTVNAGSTVQLDASASYDADHDPLTYRWSFTTVPMNSQAALSDIAAIAPTFVADLPGVYVAQLIVNDGHLDGVPTTVTITANWPYTISVALPRVSLLTYDNEVGTVNLSGTQSADVTISVSQNNASVGTISTATDNPADHVMIPAGQTSATFTLTTTNDVGSSTITAFANGFNSGTASYSASTRMLNLSVPTLVPAGRTLTATLTLNDPAPGPVVIAATSSQPSVIGVTTQPQAFAAGDTATTFTVNTLTPGQAMVSGAATVAGYTSASVPMTVVSAACGITLPVNLSLGPGEIEPFPITLGSAAPQGGVTLHFTVTPASGSSGSLIVPASVFIAAGQTSPATLPQVTGGNLGPVSVTAAADAGCYVPDTENVNVSISTSFTPTTQSVLTFNTAKLTLSLSSPAPSSLTIALHTSDPAKATVPPTLTVPTGSTSIDVTVTGVAAGDTTLTATGPSGVVSTTATVSVHDAPATTISQVPYGVSPIPPTIGNQQQVGPYYVLLALPAPAGNTNVVVTSSDATKLLLSTSASSIGSGSITIQVGAGVSSGPGFYLQALSASGSVTLHTHAVGYADATMTLSLLPSGFYLGGGGATSTLSAPTQFNVYLGAIDPATQIASGGWPLRPGATPVPIALTNSANAVGTISPSSVVYSGGDYTETALFQPVSVGSDAITLATPAGFATPANSQSIRFDVSQPGTDISYVPYGDYRAYSSLTVVGNNLQTASALYGYLLTPAPAGGRTVTLTSSDPSRLKLTTDPSAIGSASLTLIVPSGQSATAGFYMQGLASAGTVNVTLDAQDYASTVMPMTLAPSGFYLSGGGSTTTFSPPTLFSVYAGVLDPTTLNLIGNGTLSPGAPPVSMNLTNSANAIGTISPMAVTFSGGDSSRTVSFQPATAGSDTVGLSMPAGFTAPANYAPSIAFTVSAPNADITYVQYADYLAYGPYTLVGNNLESVQPLYGYLTTPAPAGGRTATLTSGDANRLLLTADPSQAGTGTLTFNVPAGQYATPAFYLQGLAGSGSVDLTLTVPGYNGWVSRIALTPAGFSTSGGGATTTFSPASAVSLQLVSLDPVTLNAAMTAELRPNSAPVTVGLVNGDSSIGTLGAGSVTFNPGDSNRTINFQPTAAGTDPITLSMPTGFTLAANSTPLVYTVSAPGTDVTYVPYADYRAYGQFLTVGNNLESTSPLYGFLLAPAPAGADRTVTLTSSDPTRLLLSADPSVAGAGSITFSVSAGQNSTPPFYLQGLAAVGTVNLTLVVPGYSSTTMPITFAQSGFYVSGGGATTTFSPVSALTVDVATLDPTTLNVNAGGQLRPGIGAVTVNLSNSADAVGTLSSSSVTFLGGESYHSVNFQPASTGTDTVTVSTPVGFTTPSNQQTAVYTVSAPSTDITLASYFDYQAYGTYLTVGYNMETVSPLYGFLLTAAPSDRTVTLTSGDGSRLKLSADPSAAGSASLTFHIAAGQIATPPFYMQALAGTGTVNLTFDVPGYNQTVRPITLAPSGFYASGGGATTPFAAPVALGASAAVLDPVSLNMIAGGQMRPGAPPVTVSFINGTPSVGTLSASSMTFNPGDTSRTVTFQALTAGSDTIGLSVPAGYVLAANSPAIVYTVTLPGTGFTYSPGCPTCGIYGSYATVGYNLQSAPIYGVLFGQSPTTQVVTITSDDSTKLLLTADPTAVGSGSLTFTLAAGQTTTPAFYLQSLAGAGAVAIHIATPSFTTSAQPITLLPSGFALQSPGNFTSHLTDSATTLQIAPAALDPVYLNVYAFQPVRPGATNNIATVVMVDNPNPDPNAPSPVGTLTPSNQVVFVGADVPGYLITSFQPTHPGSTVIHIEPQPGSGYSTASSQIVAVVTP